MERIDVTLHHCSIPFYSNQLGERERICFYFQQLLGPTCHEQPQTLFERDRPDGMVGRTGRYVSLVIAILYKSRSIGVKYASGDVILGRTYYSVIEPESSRTRSVT